MNNRRLVVLYLYSELVGYQISIFEEYVRTFDADVHVVHWDHKKIKPYIPSSLNRVFYYKRSEYDFERILDLSNKIEPDIVYVSGWMDKDYLRVTQRKKGQGIPVVTGFDDIWIGSIRQRIGSLVFPFLYKKYFSHAWVAGPYQYEFAKRLGFKNSEIIFDLLTADTRIFNSNLARDTSLNKTFLYVGNFRKVKGTDILVDAFDIYKNKFRGDWKLVVVGNGELEGIIKVDSDIVLLPFSSSDELVNIALNAGAFILPSRHDQWGVVVHEFASLGLPLILSENVGARASLLIEGFNGFSFKGNSSMDLALKMSQISEMAISDLKLMGMNSRLLAKRISVETSAANFMSVLRDKL